MTVMLEENQSFDESSIDGISTVYNIASPLLCFLNMVPLFATQKNTNMFNKWRKLNYNEVTKKKNWWR